MSTPPGTVGGDWVVRARDGSRLLEWSEVPETIRSKIAPSANDPAPSGLLAAERNPADGKILDEAGSDFLHELRHSGEVEATPSTATARLVLDGILEILTPEGFVSGPTALAAGFLGLALAEPSTALEVLSDRAVEYGSRLASEGIESLTGRLYAFHRYPRTRQALIAQTRPDAVVGVVEGGGAWREWTLRRSASTGWLTWRRRAHAWPTRNNLPYKLYVSPATHEVGIVLSSLLEALAATPAILLKVAGSPAGLCRPDKIVIYLRDSAELSCVATALADTFNGCAPQGVPFTAELYGDGLLSWAGDPPQSRAPVGGPAESWRAMVCRCLAENLCAARLAGLPERAVKEFALVRLSLDAVRVPQFSPADLPISNPITPEMP